MTARVRNRLILILVAAVGVVGLMSRTLQSTSQGVVRSSNTGDAAMFEAVTDRLRDGEPYYDAMRTELRARDYPTAHVFNWRTPGLLKAIATAPDLLHTVLLALAFGLAFFTITLPTRVTVAAIAGVFQLGTLALIAPARTFYLGEVWAGVLIALSVCAYAKQRWHAAAMVGLGALFVRELAAPYCVVCAFTALCRKRRPECAIWIAGASAYAALYALHLRAVWMHQGPSDLSHTSSWLQLGGLPFLLAVVDFQSWLILLPWPFEVAALMLLAGAILSEAPSHLRLATATYIVFFWFIGQNFNTYWSMVAWPTWAIACGYGFESLVLRTQRAGRDAGSDAHADRTIQL